MILKSCKALFAIFSLALAGCATLTGCKGQGPLIDVCFVESNPCPFTDADGISHPTANCGALKCVSEDGVDYELPFSGGDGYPAFPPDDMERLLIWCKSRGKT